MILWISEIQWETPGTDILAKLKNEIDAVEPSLILFAGDVINDGMNAEEHVDEFTELLTYLEHRGIHSFTIEGNHDEYSDYDAVIRHIDTLDYAKEISGELAEWNGITVVGVLYRYTHSLGQARQLQADFPRSYDIVLAHAERSRRIWLFELDAQYIITGHFAAILSQIQDHVFVSMGSYPAQRVLLQNNLQEVLYSREFDSFRASQDSYDTKARVNDQELIWEFEELDAELVTQRSLQDSAYPALAEHLIEAKYRIKTASKEDEREIIDELLADDVPKTHIREYIGRYDFL